MICLCQREQAMIKNWLVKWQSWQWLLLVCLLPVIWFPVGWQSLALLLLPALFLIHRATHQQFFPPTPLDINLLILLLLLFSSLLISPDPVNSLPKVVGIVGGITLFYAAITHAQQQKQGLGQLLGGVMSAGILMIIIGVVGVEWTGWAAPLNQLRQQLPPIPGTVNGTINPNELAGVLSWVLPLTLALLWGSYPKNGAWIQLGLLALIAGGGFLLWQTHSRGGILGLGGALVVMVALRFRWTKWHWLVVGSAGIFLLLLIWKQLPIFVQNPHDPLSLFSRFEIWQRATLILTDFPLTGLGINNFRHIVPILYPIFSLPPDIDIAHAHNQLLQMGVDLGLPGLIIYLSLWILIAALLWQSWRSKNSQTSILQQSLIIGLTGTFTSGWIYGMVDTIALGSRPSFLWWLLLALLVVIHQEQTRSK